MSGAWQPIEAAPKDGTRLLVFGQRGDQIDIGEWCGCGSYKRKTRDRTAYFEKAWGNGGHKFWPAPTHWMPLPPAPDSSQ
jgi:hypothetical protein